MKSKYAATDIAKWFVNRNKAAFEEMGGEKMTLLKLLKLLYYAEGSSLALGNGSLFDDPIVAWEHGPVVESVWYDYPEAYDIKFDAEKDLECIQKIDACDTNILEQVFQVFGAYSAWGLRNKTHSEDPWKITTENGTKLNRVIDRNLIAKYFKENYIEE